MTHQPSPCPPARIRLWSLREDVLVESDADPDGGLVVFTRWGEVRLTSPDPVVREWLCRMDLGPVALENVLSPQAGEGDREYGELMGVLGLLSGVVVHSVGLRGDAGPLLSAIPITQDAEFELPELVPDDVVRLSRFAAIRSSGDSLVIESALAHYRVVLHREPAVGLIGQLACAVRFTDLNPVANSDEPMLRELVSYLVAAGVVVVAGADPESGVPLFREDCDPRLIPWSHHDLMFHTRSAPGYSDEPLGAAFEHSDRLPAPPATKPPPQGRRFPLSRPLMSEVAARDTTLSEAVEGRRHYFSFDPISADDLGELLYRSARVRSVEQVPGLEGEDYTTTDRPYPSAAGTHALELYLTLDRCPGLPGGIYHYDPAGHALTLISTSESAIADMLDSARITGGIPERPPALITMTAQMSRVSWQHSGISYAMTLTQVGLLQQTMNLVATAMRLAPRALAVGSGALSTKTLGLDWPTEVTVGGFVVGSVPASR